MNLIYPIYPQTNYYPLQQVEGQAHRLWNVLNKGTLSSHHYLVVCLASVPYFVCNVFFGEKDALAAGFLLQTSGAAESILNMISQWSDDRCSFHRKQMYHHAVCWYWSCYSKIKCLLCHIFLSYFPIRYHLLVKCSTIQYYATKRKHVVRLR